MYEALKVDLLMVYFWNLEDTDSVLMIKSDAKLIVTHNCYKVTQDTKRWAHNSSKEALKHNLEVLTLCHTEHIDKN